MKPRIVIVTLTVDDLEQALRFYRDGLGLPTSGIASPDDGGDHIRFEMDGGLSFVLFLRSALAAATNQPDTGHSSLECLLSYAAETADEVDTILTSAKAAGGSIVGPATAQPWGGYSGYFADPDGHLWEVVSGLGGAR